MPPDFVSSAPQGVLVLLSSMLSSDPLRRPSAHDLLASPIIPVGVDLDHELLHAPHGALFSRVLNGVFAQPTPDFRDLAFDCSSSATSVMHSRLTIILRHVMARSGSVLIMPTSIATPQTPHFSADSLPVSFNATAPCASISTKSSLAQRRCLDLLRRR